MQQKIDWQLAESDTILVKLNNVYCKYDFKYLEFNEDDVINYIDLIKKIYKRISEKYIMEINFKDKTCTFTFPNEERCTFDIECAIKINKKNIIMKYNFDDENKTITINMKED